MSDAQSIPTKTKTEAAEKIANLRAVGYSNIALVGPVSSVQTKELGGATWLVIGTDAPIVVLAKE